MCANEIIIIIIIITEFGPMNFAGSSTKFMNRFANYCLELAKDNANLVFRRIRSRMDVKEAFANVSRQLVYAVQIELIVSIAVYCL